MPGGQNQVLLGGQNRVLPRVKIKCTLFGHPAALDFDPQGLFSKLKKLRITITKGIWIFMKIAIHLIIFLRFYGKKLFFNLGIPLSIAYYDKWVISKVSFPTPPRVVY